MGPAVFAIAFFRQHFSTGADWQGAENAGDSWM